MNRRPLFWLIICLIVVAVVLVMWQPWADQEQKPEPVIVYVTSSGTKYHRSGCEYLRKSKIQTTLEKAKRLGYKRCSVCDPPK